MASHGDYSHDKIRHDPEYASDATRWSRDGHPIRCRTHFKNSPPTSNTAPTRYPRSHAVDRTPWPTNARRFIPLAPQYNSRTTRNISLSKTNSSRGNTLCDKLYSNGTPFAPPERKRENCTRCEANPSVFLFRVALPVYYLHLSQHVPAHLLTDSGPRLHSVLR